MANLSPTEALRSELSQLMSTTSKIRKIMNKQVEELAKAFPTMSPDHKLKTTATLGSIMSAANTGMSGIARALHAADELTGQSGGNLSEEENASAMEESLLGKNHGG